MEPRSMWSCFAMENEHMRNTLGFRKERFIPLHFERKPQKKATDKRDDTQYATYQKVLMFKHNTQHRAGMGGELRQLLRSEASRQADPESQGAVHLESQRAKLEDSTDYAYKSVFLAVLVVALSALTIFVSAEVIE
ncbi:hypothetical protein DYB37_011006 [Aphanomyces astaci]|uniref:Uncharacterized protein n=1 Tax=Aphanomyces astaci TaxID=112090 RepID=A0A3R7B4E9_APHAT|nr:hypothetical protein DYB35_012940 [Aphanomyces astaci]RHZ15157.1 hypothetical protein DYB37_011006 [Aphanomyces astaci]